MMLNFDEERFLASQRGALAHAAGLHEVVAEHWAQGGENLFFLGAGGAGILMTPAADLLARESSLRTYCLAPAELMALGSVHLGSSSLVVIPSRSGDTKEALDVLDYCHRVGAKVVTLTGTAGSALSLQADVNFTNLVADDNSSESFYLQSLLVALSVMDVRGEISDYETIVAELQGLPEFLLEAKRSFEVKAPEVAAVIADSAYHLIIGAGSTWPESFYYGMCILEEMQWIRTRPVHAAHFFHGPLELVEEGVSCLLFKGEDGSAPLVERVEQFVTEYRGRLTILDTADLAAGMTQRTRSLISPIILATVLERVSAHLEVLRDHPLTTRRYYRKVSY
jgi:fructoselysine-6-phosphate deglycase